MLLNLVLNADDAMPEGGSVTVETAEADVPAGRAPRNPGFPVRPGEYVLLSVSDTGIGMNAETLERIFEPFFTTKEVGMGDGYVWATSEPARGTTLLVYLPAVPREQPSDQGAEPGARGMETILLVEDQEEVRVVAARALAHEGYRVLEAANGQEALDLLARYDDEVALVLTDLAMPSLDGRRLGDRLRQSRPGLLLLFMSGYGVEEVARRGLLAEGPPSFRSRSRPGSWPGGYGSCAMPPAARRYQGEAGRARSVLSGGASRSAVQLSIR